MNQMFDLPQMFLSLGVAMSGVYLLLLCVLYQGPGRSQPTVRPICVKTVIEANVRRRS